MGVIRNGVSLTTMLALAMGASAAWAQGTPAAPAGAEAPPAPAATVTAAPAVQPAPAQPAAAPQPAVQAPPAAAQPVAPVAPLPAIQPAAQPVTAPVPVAAAPVPVAAAPMPPLAEDEDMVEIHIESPRPVRLIRRHGDNTDWYKVCHSPCDVKVPRADELMITGKGMYRSKPFRISADRGKRVTLYINPASKKMHRAGLLALGAGGVLALGGVVVLAAGVSPDSTFDSDGLTHNENTTAIAVGSLLLVGAVTAGITGGAWTFENMKTKVEVDGAARQQNREPGTPPQTGLPSPQAMAPSFAIPLYRGTF